MTGCLIDLGLGRMMKGKILMAFLVIISRPNTRLEMAVKRSSRSLKSAILCMNYVTMISRDILM